MPGGEEAGLARTDTEVPLEVAVTFASPQDNKREDAEGSVDAQAGVGRVMNGYPVDMAVVESTPLLLTKLSVDPEPTPPPSPPAADKDSAEPKPDPELPPGQPPLELSSWQKCSNCCSRLRATVTIEPAVFIYFLGFASLRFTAQQFVYNEYLLEWTKHYGTSQAVTVDPLSSVLGGSACTDIEDDQEDEAQEKTAQFLMIYDTLCLLPGVLFVIFAGSFSDKYGRKKAVLAPCIGVTIRAVSCFLVGLTNIDVRFLYIGALIDGFMGGQCMFVATAYACVADVSGKEHRSLRFYVLQALNGVGLVAGQLSIGYLIYYTGFVYPFIIISCILALNVPLITCYMAESVNNNHSAAHPQEVTSIKHQLTRTAKILIHGPDKGAGRDKIWVVRLLLIIVLLMGISTEGLVSPLVLYLLHSPRCFTSVELAYFLVVLMGAGGAASLFVVGYLNKLLSDYGILLLGMVSALFGKLWLIIPFTNPAIGPYGCAVISCFGSLPNSMVRSALSKLAKAEDQGAMSACVTISQQLGVTVGGFFLSAVYSVTVAMYAETIFCVAAGINVIAIVLNIFVFCLRRYMRKTEQLENATRLGPLPQGNGEQNPPPEQNGSCPPEQNGSTPSQDPPEPVSPSQVEASIGEK